MQSHHNTTTPEKSTLSRRSLLKCAPAALAAASIPSTVVVADELPVARVTRLATELAHALDEYADGSMHMEIFPAKSGKGIKTVVSDLQPAPMPYLRHQIERTKIAMAKAFPDREILAHIVENEKRGGMTVVLQTAI